MQNFTAHQDAQDQDDNGHDKSRQRNALQRDIVMAEADLHKVANEKIALEAEIRKLKKDEDHLRLDLQGKRERLGKVEYEIVQADNVIKGLKKKLNLI